MELIENLLQLLTTFVGALLSGISYRKSGRQAYFLLLCFYGCFALETNNEQQNAEGKLERKNFDFIVLNSLNDAGAGFRHDTNKISIIDRKGRKDYSLKPKQEVAQDIIDHLAAVLTL